MKPLDEYRLNKRLIEFGRLSWDLLIAFSKVVIFLFLILTAMTFWNNVVVDLYFNYQIDISKQIGIMFLIILIAIILVFIDIVKNLIIRK